MPRGPTNIQNALARCRQWCFRFANPPTHEGAHQEYLERLLVIPGFIFAVMQYEQGEQGLLHWQGYIEFSTLQRFRPLKIAMGINVHLEKRKGTRDQARDYCKKEETRISGPWEAGTWRQASQGSRTDLATATYTLTETRNLSTLANEHPMEYVKYHRGFEALYARTQPKRRHAPRVILHYGATGTGKTRQVFDTFEGDLFRKAPSTKWFDGYEAQSCCLLDDFSGASSKMSLDYLLQLLDRYPIDVEVKCSYRPLLATIIIVTTNNHPRTWYDYSSREMQYRALARRFHEVIYFQEGESFQVNSDKFWFDWAQGCDEQALFAATRPNTPVSETDDSQ